MAWRLMCNFIEASAGRLRTKYANRRNHKDIARRNRYEHANDPEIPQEKGNYKSGQCCADTADRIHQSTGCRADARREELTLVGMIADR